MKTIKICNKLLILDLLTLSFFCSTYCDKSHSSEISPDFEIVQYSSESEWLNLLYYQPTGTGRFSSLVTHKSFFLSPNGQVDPYSELQETIRIFQTSDHGMAVHPQCALPARYEILSRRFRLLPPVKCQELETWISSYEPRGIDLVFTSQFVSNPASVFGHAFLLIPSKAKAEALWYTFNFAAAIPSDVDPFSYIFGGLTGWYQGDYSLLPYYQRLYQYGSIENRDLWRYPLNVSESEMILIIKHFWELIHLGKFSYYFLDQNCAGFILLSLAATLPDLAALSQLDTYVHPVDVIKTLRLKGRLKNPQMVPSSFEILKRRYDSLSQKDRKEFNLAISKNIVSMDQISFEVLECLTDYIAMQRLKNNELLPHDLEDLERRIFLARAKRPPRIQSDEVNLNPPDQSHNSHLGTLGFMRRDLDSFLSIGYRPTLHSLLDYDAGYLENSSVEVLSTKINVKANQTDLKFSLKDLTILNLETYSDFYNFDPK
ncbi:MAG: DUF4105 domain-containing protein, partial [Proteobacteria bacterium]|nr:DUF4105 domain-containing protein [Pseudomonadota bacterium]